MHKKCTAAGRYDEGKKKLNRMCIGIPNSILSFAISTHMYLNHLSVNIENFGCAFFHTFLYYQCKY